MSANFGSYSSGVGTFGTVARPSSAWGGNIAMIVHTTENPVDVISTQGGDGQGIWGFLPYPGSGLVGLALFNGGSDPFVWDEPAGAGDHLVTVLNFTGASNVPVLEPPVVLTDTGTAWAGDLAVHADDAVVFVIETAVDQTVSALTLQEAGGTYSGSKYLVPTSYNTAVAHTIAVAHSHDTLTDLSIDFTLSSGTRDTVKVTAYLVPGGTFTKATLSWNLRDVPSDPDEVRAVRFFGRSGIEEFVLEDPTGTSFEWDPEEIYSMGVQVTGYRVREYFPDGSDGVQMPLYSAPVELPFSSIWTYV